MRVAYHVAAAFPDQQPPPFSAFNFPPLAPCMSKAMGCCISALKSPKTRDDHPLQAGSSSETPAKPVSDATQPPPLVNAGYWASWKIYDGIFPSNIDPKVITHLLYAFADIDGDGTVFLKDEYLHYEIDVDGTNGGLRACTQLKRQNPNLKVLLSVGGGETSAGGLFADVAGHPQKLQRFIQSAKKLVDDFSLEGIDVDWEHPSTVKEGAQYLKMTKALRDALPTPHGRLVTTALPCDPGVLQHIPLSELAKYVDYLNLMAYDFVGPAYASVESTGHHAQLFGNGALGQQRSGAGAVDYLLRRGFPAKNIVLGVPAYAHSFLAAEALHMPFHGPGLNDEVAVSELSESLVEVYDSDAVAVFAKHDAEFITYDNKVSVAVKARYVREKGLGGLFVWHLAADRDGEESLVRAAFEVLVRSPYPQ